MIDEELIEAIGKLVAADRRRKQKQKQQAARWELISQQYDSSRASSSLSSRGSKTTPHPAADWVVCVGIARCSLFRRRSKPARGFHHHHAPSPSPPLPSTIILILRQIQQDEYHQERQPHQQRERHDHEFREEETPTNQHATTNTTNRRISTATTVAASV